MIFFCHDPVFQQRFPTSHCYIFLDIFSRDYFYFTLFFFYPSGCVLFTLCHLRSLDSDMQFKGNDIIRYLKCTLPDLRKQVKRSQSGAETDSSLIMMDLYQISPTLINQLCYIEEMIARLSKSRPHTISNLKYNQTLLNLVRLLTTGFRFKRSQMQGDFFLKPRLLILSLGTSTQTSVFVLNLLMKGHGALA